MAGIHNKFTATDDSRIGSNEGSTKLHGHMEAIEKISERAEDGDEDAEFGVCSQASRSTNGGEEEVKRVYK